MLCYNIHMFEDIKAEINKFPLTDLQKQYIESSLNIAYDMGKKDGYKDSILIAKGEEKEDLKSIEQMEENDEK